MWLTEDKGAISVNDCKYIFVSRLEEEELTLTITVSEAKEQDQILVPKDDNGLDRIKSGARPVLTDDTCRSFVLIFGRDYMVSYTVSNESYSEYPKPPEHFEGKCLRIFSWSHLLEWTKTTTCVSDSYPGPLHHYQLVCENHVIDVIATQAPHIYTSLIGVNRRLAELGGSEPDATYIPRRRSWTVDSI